MPASFLRQHSAKCLIVWLFLIPAFAGMLTSNQGTQENRALAPMPKRPGSWAEAVQYPGQLERWVNDHVGLRDELIGLNNRLRYRLFGQFPTTQVLQGKNGRLFLSDQTYQPGHFGSIQDVCGYQFHRLPDLVHQLNLFDRTMQQHKLDGKLMIVPTAAVIYPEDIPDWLARRCQGQAIPMELAVHDAQVRHPENLLYPLAQLLAAKNQYAIFPKTWFHWAGSGPRLAAELSMQQFWHTDLQTIPELKTSMSVQPSDIGHLFPGLRLNSTIEAINFEASGVKECHGPNCYPELPGIAEKLWGINRFQNAKAKLPRLVLVTDSFGLSLGPWYARYYQDVIQVATNDLGRLSKSEMQHLTRFLFRDVPAQHLLFVYHDGTIQGGNRILEDLPRLFGPEQ